MSNLAKYKNLKTFSSLASSPTSILPIVYLSIFAVAGWIFFKFFVPILKRYFQNENLIAEDKDEQEEREEVVTDIEVFEDKGQKPTYNTSQYRTYANSIYNSVGFIYDDPTIVYTNLRRLKHDLDFLLLVKAFGKRQTGIYGMREYRTLQEYLQYYYADHDKVIFYFNRILASKGIKQRI